MSGQMKAVRNYYGVPATRGSEVVFEGLRCEILSAKDLKLFLRGPDGKRIGPCHPTWSMDYEDGRDHASDFDERMRWFNGTSANQGRACPAHGGLRCDRPGCHERCEAA